MSFYGAIVKPGKKVAFVPPPEEWNLHLSQAALPPSVPAGQRASLAIRHDKGEEPIILCTLTAQHCDTANLDIFLSQYAEFIVLGKHEIHISGYYSPAAPLDGSDSEDEGEDEDFELADAMNGAEDDSDEGEDDEDEDEDEEGGDPEEEMFGFPGRRKKPQVVIEEVQEGEAANGHKADGALVVKGKAAKLHPKADSMMDVDDEDGSSDDEGDEGEDDEGEDDEGEYDSSDLSADEDEEDEEEESEEPPTTGKKPSAAQPGSKRPAEKAVAQPAKKQAVEPTKPQNQQTPKQQQQQKQAAKQQQQTPAQPAKGQQQQQTGGKQAQQQQQQTPGTSGKGQQQQTPKATPGSSAAMEVKSGKKTARRWENGFEVEDVSYGPPHGKLAKAGHKVTVQYTGRLKANGKVFDKSGNKPFSFRLGVGEVIKGWDLGVEGMKIGDKRKLVVPPQFGYGSAGAKPVIPPNATLEFDVELISVK